MTIVFSVQYRCLVEKGCTGLTLCVLLFQGQTGLTLCVLLLQGRTR